MKGLFILYTIISEKSNPLHEVLRRLKTFTFAYRTPKLYFMRILILNGPNLNLLGKREPEIYGNLSFDDFFAQMQTRYPGIEWKYFQSNIEGELIDKLHEAMEKSDAVIFNPGGYSHTSVAIADAIKSIRIPVLEVHLSNIHARENFREHSFTASVSMGVITGFGLESYALAADYLIRKSLPDADR